MFTVMVGMTVKTFMGQVRFPLITTTSTNIW